MYRLIDVNRACLALFIFLLFSLAWKCINDYQLLSICDETRRLSGSLSITQEENVLKADHIEHCVGDEAAECIPPIYPYVQNYRVSPKYHLLACTIEKNFSTMLTAILCYLYDENRFIQKGRNISTDTYRRRSCAKLNEYKSLKAVHSALNVSKWSMIAVVRNPLNRFVSGFANKCLIEEVWRKFPDRCNRCEMVSFILIN
ncbi:unnamed protein product [Cylicocyclus nassatus]|uniref:Sulfotransferase n=1 Tax=Cylicocyclus nassatus TaxID=53992 RepID=A0AA36GQ12_CYLNA|nr:unnamed protein product [Cylicocyclus nassatus]